MKVNIGKNTLGDSDKMSLSLREYGRSTHNLSYAWRSTMGVGTLVPFMKIIGLPGDTFNIDLDHKVMTHPTVGPLFGSYKLQLDLFECPIRLYNAMLHNNALKIGLDMSKVKFPKSQIGTTQTGDKYFPTINRSALLNYLGLKAEKDDYWNIVPLLAYLDIFKNYYANKQEDDFYILAHGSKTINIYGWGESIEVTKPSGENRVFIKGLIGYRAETSLEEWGGTPKIKIRKKTTDPWIDFQPTTQSNTWKFKKDERGQYIKYLEYTGTPWQLNLEPGNYEVRPEVVATWSTETGNAPVSYKLEQIDDIREYILAQGKKAIRLNNATKSEVKLLDDMLGLNTGDKKIPSLINGGLILKTHMSDIFNNWINKEWIEGDNGISALTSIDTSGGSFTIDTFNLAKKVYEMLNRIAISGGTYKDWIETVYTTDYYFRAETPVYQGGASSMIEFQEVVSNSATTEEPLGTLAGRGVTTGKKGGKITIKVNEPCYIIGIASITPYVDYSQGNDWDLELETLNDLHKPQMDGIGYQDLLTTHMYADANKGAIGKQPAWINYMTNYNKTFGNFAAGGDEAFMVLNRIYTKDQGNHNINNATTYINPQMYNYIFAETSIDSSNFWVQIGCGFEARRVMSAKQIPTF